MIAKYQEILGLDPNGRYSNDDYKKRYRTLALEHHPDMGGDEEKFKEITEAYEILTGKRQSRQRSTSFDPFSHMSDIFENINQQFHNSRVHRRPHQQRPPTHDKEITVELNLNLDEIKRGRTIPFEYTKSRECDACHGACAEKKETCTTCQGRGEIETKQSAGNISFSTVYPCPHCGGIGEKLINPCQKCSARGYIAYKERMTVKIGAE